MTIVIIMCWLTALLVPVWMIVASKLSDRGKGEWKNAAAATAIAAAVMMGLFTGAVLILVDDKTERIVGMIAGLLICLSEQAVLTANTIRELYRNNFDMRWPAVKGVAITGLVLIALALSICAVAAVNP